MDDLYIDRIETWENISSFDKRKKLFLTQKQTLDLFLERNAISKQQYDKSLGDLIEKMGMQEVVVHKENKDA